MGWRWAHRQGEAEDDHRLRDLSEEVQQQQASKQSEAGTAEHPHARDAAKVLDIKVFSLKQTTPRATRVAAVWVGHEVCIRDGLDEERVPAAVGCVCSA